MKNLNTILPFYDSASEQHANRGDLLRTRNYFRLLCGTKAIIPFVIRREHTSGTTADLTFQIVDEATMVGTLVTPIANYIVIAPGATYDYIYYTAKIDFSFTMDIGSEIYAVVTDTSQTPTKIYYSERLVVSQNLDECVLLELSNDTMISNIMAGFEQSMYVPNKLKVREYPRKDTGTERDGMMVYESKIIIYQDNLNILNAPQFLCDALVLLPMMDTVEITDQREDCYEAFETKVKDPEWSADSGGTEAKLIIQFIKEFVIKKNSFKEMACTCGSSNSGATVNQGLAVVVGGTPKVVVFSTAFSDVTYSLTLRAYDDDGNTVIVNVSSHTTSYFTVNSLVDCTVEWIAAEE